MDPIFSDENVQYILTEGIKKNQQNNPYGSFTILISNIISAFRQLCIDNGKEYEEIMPEIGESEELKGFFIAYNKTAKMTRNPDLFHWIENLPNIENQQELFIYYKAIDGMLLRELEKEYWKKETLVNKFTDFANNIHNYLNFDFDNFFNFKTFSSNSKENESISLKISESFREALHESLDPMKQIDDHLIESEGHAIDKNYFNLFDKLSKVDWGTKANSFSAPFFNEIFQQLLILHSSKRLSAVMSLHELLLILFPNLFTTMEEWEKLHNESSVKNKSYNKCIEREIFRFINYRK